MGFWHAYMGIEGGGLVVAVDPRDGWVAPEVSRVWAAPETSRVWVCKVSKDSDNG